MTASTDLESFQGRERDLKPLGRGLPTTNPEYPVVLTGWPRSGHNGPHSMRPPVVEFPSPAPTTAQKIQDLRSMLHLISRTTEMVEQQLDEILEEKSKHQGK